MQNLEPLKRLLETPKRIVITTHAKPDADALGSSLGLSAFLQKKGHSVSVITPTDYPDFLNWMHGNEHIIVFDPRKPAPVAALIADSELIFCLDFSALARINEMAVLVKKASAIKVMIDHHIDPEDFADFTYSDTTSAATAQMIFKLIEKLGEKYLIDIPIGECLYAGIMTDTGSFKYDCTSAEVHQIAAELITLGVKTTRIHRIIYDNTTLDKLKFLGYVLSEKLVVLPEYRVAYIVITDEELKRFHSKTGDTEGVVNYALSIENIVMAAIIIDRVDIVKMSFRSIGNFSVNEFARSNFEGGGHRNASGGVSKLSLKATLQQFLEALPHYQEKLLQASNT